MSRLGDSGELSGHTLGQYEIGGMLGEGGMAAVYQAQQVSIGRTVAIKVMPSHFMRDKGFLARFEREVKVIAGLQHPRVVPVYDFGHVENRPYIVMAYLSGGTLEDRIKQAKLPLDEAVRLVQQIAEGLDFAHGKGIIHRDFKPANVLLDEQGNAHLADFGIARLTESTSKLTGSGIVGTPTYIAPEALSGGEITSAVDIYALGVTLYEMLAGTAPFSGDTPMRLLTAHLYDPIPDVREARPELPIGVTHVIQRAMAKDPSARYTSAGALAAALVDAAAGKSITPPPIGNHPITTVYLGADGKLIRRKPMPRGVWIGAGTVVLVAAIVGGMAALGMFNGALSGAAPTAEYSETADSSLLFAAATDDEVLVIVTDFEQEGVNADTRIYQGLVEKIRTKQVEGVRVERLEGVKPLLQEDAVAVGEAYNATLVIWGTADSFGIEPHYEIVRNQEVITGDVVLGASSDGDASSYSAYITDGMNSEFEFLMLYILGQLAIANDQPEKAVALLGEAVSIDLGSTGSALGLVDANVLRCKTNWRMGNNERAIEDCTAALELDPDSTSARYFRGIIYAEVGKDEEALADLNQLFNYNNLTPKSVLISQGETFTEMRLPKPGLLYLNWAIEKDPLLLDAYVERGYALRMLGQFDAALSDFTYALEIARNDSERWRIHGNRAWVYAATGDLEAAAADADRVVELQPNLLWSYNFRAYLLATNNIEIEKAKSDIDMAFELAEAEDLSPAEEAGLLDTRAFVYYRLGDYDAAQADIERAFELLEDVGASPDASYFTRAVIYDALGNTNEAISFYLLYFESEPPTTAIIMNRMAAERLQALGVEIP